MIVCLFIGSAARIASTIADTGYSVNQFALDQAVMIALGMMYRVIALGILQYRVRYHKPV